MAKFYCNSSRHLQKSDAKYFFSAVAIILLPLVLVWTVERYTPPLAVLLVALLFIAIIVKMGDPLIHFFEVKSIKYSHGWSGELAVKNVLRHLPNTYTVFQDLVIEKGKGDIDFIIVGPKGIIPLEVKSHRGQVGYQDGLLTLNGRNIKEKNFLRQAHGLTHALKNYLQQQTGMSFFLPTALVFSNPSAEIHIQTQPVENVYVIQKAYLLPLIAALPEFNYPVPREKIETSLMEVLNG